MATKKYLELKEFSSEDLANELKETKAQFQKLKFDHAIKGLDNPQVLKEIRRDIARLETESRSRELVAFTEDQIAKRSKLRRKRKNN